MRGKIACGTHNLNYSTFYHFDVTNDTLAIETSEILKEGSTHGVMEYGF